jgi:hypothetical protein
LARPTTIEPVAENIFRSVYLLAFTDRGSIMTKSAEMAVVGQPNEDR